MDNAAPSGRLPGGVGWTALMTAYARARETARHDRLFADPWAQRLVAASAEADGSGLPRLGPAREDAGSIVWDSLVTYFTVRTPFYDEQVRAACAAGHRQVVLLAAGLDARAWRLDLPEGTAVYEVDTRPVLDYKHAVLTEQPRNHRVPVVADLREDWPDALRRAGHDPAQPTVWLVEGLLMYLDAADCDRLLSTIGELTPDTGRIALEYFGHGDPTESPLVADAEERDRAATAFTGSLFREGPPAEPGKWLTGHGWRPDVSSVAEQARRCARPVPEVFDPRHPDGVTVWLAAGAPH
jgi:methyltransferase (TIGR00027 family)